VDGNLGWADLNFEHHNTKHAYPEKPGNLHEIIQRRENVFVSAEFP
jgi:hypothetical protein